jgi:predicted esterase
MLSEPVPLYPRRHANAENDVAADHPTSQRFLFVEILDIQAQDARQVVLRVGFGEGARIATAVCLKASAVFTDISRYRCN